MGRGEQNKTKQKHSSCKKKNANSSISNTEGLEKKERKKCRRCDGWHPPESDHIVLLYCMPVLEAMLDQGSKERSRDWACRYNL